MRIFCDDPPLDLNENYTIVSDDKDSYIISGLGIYHKVKFKDEQLKKMRNKHFQITDYFDRNQHCNGYAYFGKK